MKISLRVCVLTPLIDVVVASVCDAVVLVVVVVPVRIIVATDI